MKNPETAFLNTLSEKLEKERFQNKLSERAREVFRVNPPLDPEDFRGVPGYTEEEIASDTEYVREMGQRFDKEDTPEQKKLKEFAKILEAMLNELIELYDWLGPNAETITTSDYDDIKNGVDMVAEFQRESRLLGDQPERRGKSASHLALAVDVTFASDIGKKIDRIKREIENGELTRIKYFASEFLEHRGELTNIPRVIIGADVESIKKLGRTWVEGDKKTLATHEMQRVILEEIRVQLEVFAGYARMKNKNEVAEIYSATLQTINGILEDKREIPLEAFAEDKVFRAIRREAGRIKSDA